MPNASVPAADTGLPNAEPATIRSAIFGMEGSIHRTRTLLDAAIRLLEPAGELSGVDREALMSVVYCVSEAADETKEGWNRARTLANERA